MSKSSILIDRTFDYLLIISSYLSNSILYWSQFYRRVIKYRSMILGNKWQCILYICICFIWYVSDISQLEIAEQLSTSVIPHQVTFDELFYATLSAILWRPGWNVLVFQKNWVKREHIHENKVWRQLPV
jgi:hypothetical protein